MCTSTDQTLWTVANDPDGIALLTEHLVEVGPTLVILEATGGFEAHVAAELAVGGCSVAVVNPKQVRDFARAIGRVAKTDAIDAAVLAQFAQALKPQPRLLPDADQLQLRHLVRRRSQIVCMVDSERNRLRYAPDALRQHIRRHIDYLCDDRSDIDRRSEL